MKKKQTPRSRKPAKQNEARRTDPVVVLDVEVSFSTHVHQHVAVPFYTDVPLRDWTRDLFIAAAKQACVALPRKDALTMGHAHWNDGAIKLSVGADDGEYPFMSVEIARCPCDVFTRSFSDDAYSVAAVLTRIPVRDAQRSGDGVSIAAPGTVRDQYPADDPGCFDLNEPAEKFRARLDRRDHERGRAIRAARRAAGLPLTGHQQHERRAR